MRALRTARWGEVGERTTCVNACLCASLNSNLVIGLAISSPFFAYTMAG